MIELMGMELLVTIPHLHQSLLAKDSVISSYVTLPCISIRLTD